MIQVFRVLRRCILVRLRARRIVSIRRSRIARSYIDMLTPHHLESGLTLEDIEQAGDIFAQEIIRLNRYRASKAKIRRELRAMGMEIPEELKG